MATDAETMSTNITQTITILNLLLANPTPTITIGPETYDMAGYLSALKDTLPILLRVRQDLAGPYMRVQRMRT